MGKFNLRSNRLETNRLYGQNLSGADMMPGTPVYIVNNENGILQFGAADSSDPNKMPCIGVTSTVIRAGNDGDIIIGGYAEVTVSGLAGVSVGDSLYVAAGGGLSLTPGSDPQVISSVLKVPIPGVISEFLVAFGGAGAGGGGGATITDPMPFELGNLSFGRLTGTGTFTPPAGGIGIVDFIENVLAEQVLSINASPNSFQYNATSLNATITPTFSASWTTATVTRTLNGTPTVIEATAVSGTPISDPLTLTGFTNYTLNYTLNVTDDFGTSDSASDSINQISYAAPTVSSFVPGRTAGASLANNETNYFREIGNFNSSVSFTTNRNSPLVDLTSVELLRGGVIDTETPTNPTHAFSHADNAAPTTGASYTYSVKMYDGSPSSPATYTAGAISFNKPVLFTTDTGAYTSSSSNSDIQNVINNYTSSAGTYTLRNNESAMSFTALAAHNDNTKYTYIIYDSTLGPATIIKQGGEFGTEVTLNNLGSFTVTNQYNESIGVQVYRSISTQAFSPDVTVYIEF